MTIDQQKRIAPLAAYFAALLVSGIGGTWAHHLSRYPLWLILIVAIMTLGVIPWLIWLTTPKLSSTK